jgi:hypothetical protein
MLLPRQDIVRPWAVFIYGLFLLLMTLTVSDILCVGPNGMISDLWIGEDVGGSCYDLGWGTALAFTLHANGNQPVSS